MRRVVWFVMVGAFFAIAFVSGESNSSLRWIWIVAFIAVSRFGRGRRRKRYSNDDPPDPAWTPIHEAVRSQTLDRLPTLIASGIDVNSRDSEGITPLHVAVMTGNLTAIEDLIGYGADVTEVDNTDSTVLVMAMIRRRFELVPPLILAGADPDQVNTHGMSARSIAIEMNVSHLLNEE